MDEKSRILKDRLEAEKYCKNWHNNIKDWRKLYNFDHYETKPKPGESQYNDPTYTNATDLAVGILLGNEMHWHAFGWNPSNKENEESGSIEKYLAGLVDINSMRNQYHIPYELNLNFVRDGVGVLYSVWDTELEKRYATTAEVEDLQSPDGVSSVTAYSQPPILLQVIDPLTIFLLPGGDERWRCIYRIEKMSVYDVENTYGVELSKYKTYPIDRKQQTKGKFVDYWAIEYENGERVIKNAVLFEEEFIWEPRVMEGYESLPYSISFYKPTSREKPEEWSNVMVPLKDSVSQLERMINRRGRQVDVFSALPVVARTQSGRVIQLDPGLGKLVQLSVGEDIGFPQWPGNPPDVDKQIEFYRGRLQQSGFSDVMYGSGPSQISGYALSQLSDQGRIRLEQPIKHLELLWSMWARKTLDITSAFGAGSQVRVYGRMRGRDFVEQVPGTDAKEYLVRAQIRAEYPNEKTRNHAMSTQVRGQLSDRSIMERYLNVDQPDDELERRLIESLQMHPLVQQYTMMQELTRLAETGDEVAMQVLQAMQQQMQPQQGAQGQSPANPEQLTGLQSPTGMPTRQAQGGQPMGQSMEDLMNQMAGASPNMEGGV